MNKSKIVDDEGFYGVELAVASTRHSATECSAASPTHSVQSVFQGARGLRSLPRLGLLGDLPTSELCQLPLYESYL